MVCLIVDTLLLSNRFKVPSKSTENLSQASWPVIGVLIVLDFKELPTNSIRFKEKTSIVSLFFKGIISIIFTLFVVQPSGCDIKQTLKYTEKISMVPVQG